MERLQKFLANNGVAARRKCEQYIEDGRVTVNGVVATKRGMQIDPVNDIICFNGKRITIAEKHYYILHKPKKVISTVVDEYGRQSVSMYFKKEEKKYDIKLKPVGRLDKDTTGLLIMTNDGEFINAMLHPKYEIKKTYIVTFNYPIADFQIKQLQQGVTIISKRRPYLTAPAFVKRIGLQKVIISIHEGKNRQIKKMAEAIGLKVINLHRVSFANLKLEELKPGDFRELSEDEILELKNQVMGANVLEMAEMEDM